MVFQPWLFLGFIVAFLARSLYISHVPSGTLSSAHVYNISSLLIKKIFVNAKQLIKLCLMKLMALATEMNKKKNCHSKTCKDDQVYYKHLSVNYQVALPINHV